MSEEIKMELTAALNIQFFERDLDDLLVTAFEGGINYWACDTKWIKETEEEKALAEKCESASEYLSRGGRIYIVIDNEDGPDGPDGKGRKRELTRPMLLSAITRFINETGKNIFEDHDANDADTIVQYAIFNEVIYG